MWQLVLRSQTLFKIIDYIVKFSAPLAEILGHADAAMESIDFTTAVVKAIDKLLARQKLVPGDIAQWEVNEAFASVVLAVERAFDIEREVMNPHGGAISLGHPFGASGARITSRLAHTLKVCPFFQVLRTVFRLALLT